MRVRLACEALTWGQDYETAVREIAEIGFQGTELWLPQNLAMMGEIKSLLRRYNLKATGTYVTCRFDDLEHATQEIASVVESAARLAEIECDRIILAASSRPHDTPIDVEMYERFADGCNEVARQCAEKYAIQTVSHNHAGTLIESPEEIDLLCQLTDPEIVFMGFDTAHIAYGGGDPAKVFRKHISRVRYLHIKDLNPEVAQYPTIAERNAHKPEHVFVELGRGSIGDAGLDAVLDVLREANYEGWITNELDTTPLTPKEANANCYHWLRQHLRPDELME